MARLETAVLEQEDLGDVLVKRTGYLQAACKAPKVVPPCMGLTF